MAGSSRHVGARRARDRRRPGHRAGHHRGDSSPPGPRVVICGRSEPGELPTAGGPHRGVRRGRRARRRRRRPTGARPSPRPTDGSTSWSTTRAVRRRSTRPPCRRSSPGRSSSSTCSRHSSAPSEANAVMQRQDDGGSIVNIASVSGLRPSPGTAAYGAAKAGLAEPHPDARRGLRAQGSGQRGQRGADPHRAVAPPLRRRGRASPPSGPPCRSAAWARRTTSRTPASSSPLRSPAYVSGANLLVHGGGERPAYLDAADAT